MFGIDSGWTVQDSIETVLPGISVRAGSGWLAAWSSCHDTDWSDQARLMPRAAQTTGRHLLLIFIYIDLYLAPGLLDQLSYFVQVCPCDARQEVQGLSSIFYISQTDDD